MLRNSYFCCELHTGVVDQDILSSASYQDNQQLLVTKLKTYCLEGSDNDAAVEGGRETSGLRDDVGDNEDLEMGDIIEEALKLSGISVSQYYCFCKLF